MAKGRCCGEPSLPKVLSDITLIDPVIYNPEFHNTVFMKSCGGADVTEKTPVFTCQDLADGAMISKDPGNIIRPGSDGGVYAGIADDPRNVTVLDEEGNILTPISGDAGNKIVKGTDGGIFVNWDASVVTALVGCDNQPHAAGTTIPSCAQMQEAIDNHTGPDPVTQIQNCNGAFHGPGTAIPACVDLDNAINNLAENITSHINGCDGQPHASGTPMPSCAQMQAAIDAANGNGSGPDSPLSYKSLISSKVGSSISGRVYGPPGTFVRADISFFGSGGSGDTWPALGSSEIPAQGWLPWSMNAGSEAGEQGLVRFYGGSAPDSLSLVHTDLY